MTRDLAQIEAEVLNCFEALCQGRHSTRVGNYAPADSSTSTPFQPDFRGLDNFLVGGTPFLFVADSALVDLSQPVVCVFYLFVYAEISGVPSPG